MDTQSITEPTAASICDTLGRKAIAERIGVGITAVSNASVEGAFSASWYDTINAMCAEARIDCPKHLFKWKRAGREA